MSSDSSDSEVSERNAAPAGGDSDDSAPSHRSASPPPRANEAPASDSDGSGPTSSPQRKRVVSGSDSDASANEQPPRRKNDSSQQDDSDADSEKIKTRPERGSQDNSDADSIQGIRMYAENGEEEDKDEPHIIEAETAAIDMDIPSFNPRFVRFPNFLSVEKKPFDPEYYEEDEEEDALDAEGRNRLKLRVENTIRWRASQDDMKESNAKMVKWSDGSMSLHLGTEIFDVRVMPVHDHNHLFIRQGLGLTGQAVFTEKFHLRPHSTDSQTHKKVTMSMADRTRKSGQVKMISTVGHNPDKEKQDMVRKEEEALRAAYRRDTMQRRARDKGRYGGLSSSFLEGRGYDSEDDSPAAIKRAYQKGGKYEAPLIGASDDSEDSDAERRLKDAQRDSSEDSDEDLRKKQKQTKKVIVESDEDSD